jgi:hypothetical protein
MNRKILNKDPLEFRVEILEKIINLLDGKLNKIKVIKKINPKYTLEDFITLIANKDTYTSPSHKNGWYILYTSYDHNFFFEEKDLYNPIKNFINKDISDSLNFKTMIMILTNCAFNEMQKYNLEEKNYLTYLLNQGLNIKKCHN